MHMEKKVLIVGGRKYIQGSPLFAHWVATYPIEFVGEDALVPEAKFEAIKKYFENLPAFLVEKRISGEQSQE